MGAWGFGIFDDDAALDIRDAWIDWYRETTSAPEATTALRSEHEEEFSDPDDGPVAELALALTLWKHGVLDAVTSAAALRVIDEQRGLELWREQGEKAVAARLRAYAKTREQLTATQPTVKKYPKRKPKPADDPGLEVGDVFSLPILLPDGSRGEGRGYFRVIRVDQEHNHRRPAVRLLALPADGTEPSPGQLAVASAVGFRNFTNIAGVNVRHFAMLVHEWPARDSPRQDLVRHGRFAVSQDDRGEPNWIYASVMWAQLGACVEPSLDTSRWMTDKDIAAWYAERSAAQIRAEINVIERELRRSHADRWAVCVPPNRMVSYERDFARAEPIFELATRMFPDDRHAWQYLGRVKWHLGDREAAEGLWLKAFDLAKEPADKKYSLEQAQLVRSGRDFEEQPGKASTAGGGKD
jgi:hypothetical protein